MTARIRLLPLLLVSGLSLLAQAPDAPPPTPDVKVVPLGAPLPANPIDRIKQRNLFHPTRGLMKAGPGGATQARSPLPTLLGTFVTSTQKRAILQFPGVAESVVVEEGQEMQGLHVVRITKDRVQVVLDPKQGPVWLSLEEAHPDSEGRGELEGLVGLTRPNQPPTPTPALPPKGQPRP